MTKTTWKTNDSCPIRPRRREKIFWLSLFNRCLCVLIMAGGIAYLVCSNDIAIKSFVLSDLDRKIGEKQKEREALVMLSLDLQSMTAVDRRAQELKMVKVDTIDYISGGDAAVAIR